MLKKSQKPVVLVCNKADNMQRDKEVTIQLKEMGWTVLRFWEWQIKKHLDECVNAIIETVEASRSNEGVSASSRDEAQ